MTIMEKKRYIVPKIWDMELASSSLLAGSGINAGQDGNGGSAKENTDFSWDDWDEGERSQSGVSKGYWDD